MRFLIDECLTNGLVDVANAAGYEAQHVVRIGKASWKDWNVAAFATDGDFILVTNNASDFRQLYTSVPIHAGLVIIVPNVKRAMQQRLFGYALERLEEIGELVNQVLEVSVEDGDVIFTVYGLPTDRTSAMLPPRE